MTIKEVIYSLVGRDRLSPVLAQIGVRGAQAGKIIRNLRQQTSSMSADFREAAREVPGLSRALSMVRNPLIIAGASVAAVGAGLAAATRQAISFNREFRNIANLNLSRTNSDLRTLKALISEVAYSSGADLNATSTAFYDVQSITGLYGAQAAPMVRRGIEFARILGADPNEWVAGLAKAQANYGFKAAEVDKYQAAAYASLVAGAMTFDQLAKSSPVFAGSAAASGQSYTDALKMFTLFTMRTKSTDEAATMTNSLFRDLTREGTVKGFLNAGINPYDEGGNFRSVIELMTELADKFASQQTQQQVNALKNAFTGSEGLTALLNAAAGGAEQLALQLHNFESAELNLARARELAAEDPALQMEAMWNRLKNQAAQLGTMFLPAVSRAVDRLLTLSEFLGNIFGDETTVKMIGARQERAAFEQAYGYDFAALDDQRKQELRRNIEENRRVYQQRIEKAERRIGANAEKGKWLPNYDSQFKNLYGGRARLAVLDQIWEEAGFGDDATAALQVPAAAGGGAAGDTAAAAASAISSAIGGGRQQKVINVSIGSLIGTQSFNSTVRESREDIRAIVEEALIRAIYGAEQMAAQ